MEGRANEALIAFLAETFEIPKRSVELVEWRVVAEQGVSAPWGLPKGWEITDRGASLIVDSQVSESRPGAPRSYVIQRNRRGSAWDSLLVSASRCRVRAYAIRLHQSSSSSILTVRRGIQAMIQSPAASNSYGPPISREWLWDCMWAVAAGRRRWSAQVSSCHFDERCSKMASGMPRSLHQRYSKRWCSR